MALTTASPPLVDERSVEERLATVDKIIMACAEVGVAIKRGTEPELYATPPTMAARVIARKAAALVALSEGRKTIYCIQHSPINRHMGCTLVSPLEVIQNPALTCGQP